MLQNNKRIQKIAVIVTTALLVSVSFGESFTELDGENK